MYGSDCVPWLEMVALLAEGVDRNAVGAGHPGQPVRSPSSRRAWIEIDVVTREYLVKVVALLAEGVDRNEPHTVGTQYIVSRPPRGGRG